MEPSLFEKLASSEMVRKFHTLYGTEISIPNLQELAKYSYTEPDKSNS